MSKRKQYFKIGEVVKELKSEFTEISVSKIRFLESSGLFKANRTESGYRKFTDRDIKKLKAILKLQRDRFLPLDEIKKKVSKINKGELNIDEIAEETSDEEIFKEQELTSINQSEIIKKTKTDKKFLKELDTFRIINPIKDKKEIKYSPIEVRLVKIAQNLQRYGIEPRHLRMHKNIIDNETLLLEQILLPELKQKSKDSKKAVNKKLNELVRLFGELRLALLQDSIKKAFQDYL